jgi:hypothetical protein
MTTLNNHTVGEHFANRDPLVKATYAAILKVSRQFGPVIEDPKKTSIHLNRRTAFAGIATRKSALVLTVKSPVDVKSPRITKREQASKNRWHLEIKLEDPSAIDAEIRALLEQSYAMSE